jgi:predicted DNA-binding transcriptional regulator AlpA
MSNAERPLAFDEDPSLDVYDVMRILGLSRAYVYEIMKQMEHERHGRAIRVRRSVLEQWRKEQTVCGSISTSEATSGGFEGPREDSSSGARRSTKANPSRADSATAGKGRSPTRFISVRTKPRSTERPSGS